MIYVVKSYILFSWKASGERPSRSQKQYFTRGARVRDAGKGSMLSRKWLGNSREIAPRCEKEALTVDLWDAPVAYVRAGEPRPR
jgi:hypothetical protein